MKKTDKKTRRNFIVLERKLFICENCNREILGGGVVNHCSFCLWSKHLDLFIPGDRDSNCYGMMEPMAVEQKHQKWRIKHKCLKCGIERINNASSYDNLDKIIQLSILLKYQQFDLHK